MRNQRSPSTYYSYSASKVLDQFSVDVEVNALFP